MWKQKIGISVSGNGEKAKLLLPMLKQIGFDAVSPEWCDIDNLRQFTAEANECGLHVQSLHSPYSGAAKMWSADFEERDREAAPVMESLEGCAICGIKTLVVHCWIGFDYRFDTSGLSYEAYDKLVERANQLGVNIAFENTEGEEYLYELLSRYKSKENVGFCWDSGHEMCYNHSNDLLALYGDRLFMTHINDNLGISRYDGNTFWTDDLHLLPFDGVCDWESAVQRLSGAKKQEYINFELGRSSKPDRHENDRYTKMSDIEYYTDAYVRACKIAYKIYR